MAVDPSSPTHPGIPDQVGLDEVELEQAEHEALRSAAVWYFKRHARIIAERADDGSAYAVVERERYLELHSALWKLGVRLALPDELAPHRIAS